MTDVPNVGTTDITARARRLARRGHLDEALSALRADAAKDFDRDPAALDLAARILTQQGRWLEAERCWRAAAALAPDDPGPRAGLARLRVAAAPVGNRGWGTAVVLGIGAAVLCVTLWTAAVQAPRAVARLEAAEAALLARTDALAGDLAGLRAGDVEPLRIALDVLRAEVAAQSEASAARALDTADGIEAARTAAETLTHDLAGERSATRDAIRKLSAEIAAARSERTAAVEALRETLNARDEALSAEIRDATFEAGRAFAETAEALRGEVSTSGSQVQALIAQVDAAATADAEGRERLAAAAQTAAEAAAAERTALVSAIREVRERMDASAARQAEAQAAARDEFAMAFRAETAPLAREIAALRGEADEIASALARLEAAVAGD